MCELEFQFISEFTVEFSTKHHLLAICKHEIISRFGNIVPSSLCDGRVPRRASVACQLLFSDQIDIVWFNLFVCYWFCLFFLLIVLFMYYCFHMMGAKWSFTTKALFFYDYIFDILSFCIIMNVGLKSRRLKKEDEISQIILLLNFEKYNFCAKVFHMVTKWALKKIF